MIIKIIRHPKYLRIMPTPIHFKRGKMMRKEFRIKSIGAKELNLRSFNK